jgi:hypothetical protein
MHYYYSDTEKDDAGFKGINTDKINPHKPYMKHVANWFQLQFIYNSTDSMTEKFQVTKELVICERKINFWYKKAAFDPSVVGPEIKKLKDLWKTVDFRPGQRDQQQTAWIKQKGWK